MLSPMLVLAQDSSAGATNGSAGLTHNAMFDSLNILNDPEMLLESLAKLPFIAAATIVIVGVLCVFNGYRWHKWVIAILAFLCGIGLGYLLSLQMGKSVIVAVSIGCLFAIIATPLLRVTVAVFGGITGAFIGSNAWTAIHMTPPDAHWAGAVIGFIVLGMTSLLMFRLVVVLFTSVGGAAMVTLGGITLLMHVPDWKNAVQDSLNSRPLLIPLLMLLAAVGGFVIQESRLRAHGMGILENENPPPAAE